VKVLEDDLHRRPDIDLVIIDELAQVARNAQTDRWKSLRTLLGIRKWTWGMTGTPTPNAPTDAWAQARLITPSTVPTFFAHFRDATMRQTAAYTWVVRDEANDIVHQAMQPAIRFKRDDCIDLPPVTYETREVALTKDQQGVYDSMLAKLYAEYQGGEITAVNEAVKTMKLVQIAVGGVYDADGNTITIPPKARVQALLEVIEEAASKVIVFVPFKSALRSLHEQVSKHYTAEMIYGEVSKPDRDRILGDFQHGTDPQVLIAQPAAMSHGLTLTAASVIVWFAPITSAETYEQANARITRPGQKLNQLIVHIQGTPLEARMYKRLAKKVTMQGMLLDLFREQVRP
jgi:SNF2 family DNA or RNA helicase